MAQARLVLQSSLAVWLTTGIIRVGLFIGGAGKFGQVSKMSMMSLETQLPILLTEQRSIHPDLDELYGRIQISASNKYVGPCLCRIPLLKYPEFIFCFIIFVTRLTLDVMRTRLWHQLSLAVEELSKAPCFQVDGNHELLDLYKNFVADQAPTALWTGFASRMNPLKHASLAIVVSKQFGGEYCCVSCRMALEFILKHLNADQESGITGSIEFLEEVGTKLSGDKEAHLLVRLEQQIKQVGFTNLQFAKT